MIHANHFSHLDAPVMLLDSLDTPIPFDAGLEQQFLAKGRLRAAMERLASY